MAHTLVFADDDDAASALTEALRDAGVEVHAVPDEESPLSNDAGKRAETVLLDLDMPRMDGFEAARQILAAECTRRLVALTGRPTQDACRKAEAAGFDEVLSKPISVALLTRALFPEAEEDEALLD